MGVLSRSPEVQETTKTKEMKVVSHTEANLKDIIMKKYGMTRSSLRSDVKHLRDWATKHPDVPNIFQVMTDEWLENQLIMSKNSLARAKRSIESYWRGRLVCPELFAERNPSSQAIQRSFDNLSVCLSQGLSSCCYRLCNVRLESPDESEFDLVAILKRASILMELLLREGVDFSGFILVIDLLNFRLSHLKRINFTSLSIMSMVMKSYPICMTKIYLINYPYFIEKVLQLFKPFLTKKMQSRIELTSIENISGQFQSSLLPCEFNGSAGAIKSLNKDLQQRLVQTGDYISSIDKVIFEQRLTSRQLDVSLSSSFRKLEID